MDERLQAAIRKSGLALGFTELKDKQVEAMSSFLKRKDTLLAVSRMPDTG